MTTHPKRLRGTAIVEYVWQDTPGVLVVVDPNGQWLLPGGGIEGNEARISAAIRELHEEIGMRAESAHYLFTHTSHNEHKVYFINARGTPTIRNVHEVRAIGICRDDLTIIPITRLPHPAPRGLSDGTRAILTRFFNERHRLLETQPQPTVPSSTEPIWEVLDQVTVHYRSQPRTIEIVRGDLAHIPPEEAVDVLVVSALPGRYEPSRNSLIGTLHHKGVSVAELARNKAEDLRPYNTCWLSQPVVASDPGIQFDRILCFEPLDKGSPPEVVGDIFEGLTSFAANERISFKRVAMPLLATGRQGVAIVDMLIPLFDAATNWMQRGLPIERLKIVAGNDISAAELRGAFRVLKHQYEQQQQPVSESPTGTTIIRPPLRKDPPARPIQTTVALSPGASTQSSTLVPTQPDYQYDLFISYSWANMQLVDLLVAELQTLRPDLRIFLDRMVFNPGCAWQQQIFDALDQCRKVVTVYSPAYLKSKMCRVEFNAAHWRHVYSNDPVLIPIFLESTNLWSVMNISQYIDCREADPARIKAACVDIVKQL